jgi:hypothetical protein
MRQRLLCIGLALTALAAMSCGKHYITLQYAPTTTVIPPERRGGTIHVKDVTFSGEGYDHIVILDPISKELTHVDGYIWQPDAVERISSMLRERLEAHATALGFSVAYNSIPRPSLVLDGELQELIAVGSDDDELERVTVRMKFVLYDPTDRDRRNLLAPPVRTATATVSGAELDGVASAMSAAVSSLVDAVVADVVRGLPLATR